MPPLDRSIYDFATSIPNTRLFEQQSSRERTVIGFITKRASIANTRIMLNNINRSSIVRQQLPATNDNRHFDPTTAYEPISK